jgi:hypothetical protein
MLNLTSPEIAALSSGALVVRDLVWLTVRRRDTGAPVELGFWSDVGNVQFTVIDGITGSQVARSFIGGVLRKVGSIENVSDLSVITVEIELVSFDANVEQAMREYDIRLAPVQIYMQLFNPETMLPTAPARPRFVGYIDEAPIKDNKVGEESSTRLVAASQSMELRRANTDVRSHASQILRQAGDGFYKSTATIGDRDIAWGENKRPASVAQVV